MAKGEIKKGPWTDQEDMQLVCYVKLFGERRWDFIAKVSGLNRTGKSCRLRWVNYLHPGLKRGRMTPEEERFIIELHAHWGNRWSLIAGKLPGRTDNEIKNYWRTHMRKVAQEKKRKAPSSSNSTITSNSQFSSVTEFQAYANAMDQEVGSTIDSSSQAKAKYVETLKSYSMDHIWNEISSLECTPSPKWKYCHSSLWKIDGEEPEIYNPISLSNPCSQYNYSNYSSKM